MAGLLLLSLLSIIVSYLTKTIDIAGFTERLGFWGYLFLLAGITIGGIIIPLSTLPFLIVGSALYGYWPTFILYYFGNTVFAPIIDFLIAQKWGRPAIEKLGGQRALKEIDAIAEVATWRSLAVLRFLGGILFDSISYAVGLTKIGFKTYALLSFTLPIPGMLLSLYFIQQSVAVSPLYLATIAIWGYAAGAGTMYYIYRKRRRLR